MALAARAQQEALLQLVSFASLSASFTAPALWPPLEPGFFSILLLRTSFDGAFPLASYIHLWHISVHS